MSAASAKLGFQGAWSMAVGGMVGGGIFSTLGVVIGIAGAWAWLSFVVAGLIALASGYSYVKLAGHYGEGGGAFTFLREIDAEGFAGSVSWVLIVGYVLTNAVYAFTFGEYLGNVAGLGPWFARRAGRGGEPGFPRHLRRRLRPRLRGASGRASRAGVASSLALLAVTGIGPASAIVIRHDREDRRHVELAAAYPEVVHLELETPTGPPDCEGTLVAPRWVATAAHAAVEVAPGHRVSVHGVAATVESIFIHPAWEDGPHDLALLHLAASVPGVEPARLYREHDEVGQVVTVVGRGDTGDGRSGPVRNDGLTRAATNRIDSASELWLKFAFDQGEAATELEGISGPGDSGGPAFVDRGGVRYLLGVGSGQSTRATGGREGLYGVTEYYTRISTHVDWLDSTMRRADERPAGTESAPVAQLSRAGATARAGGAER